MVLSIALLAAMKLPYFRYVSRGCIPQPAGIQGVGVVDIELKKVRKPESFGV